MMSCALFSPTVICIVLFGSNTNYTSLDCHLLIFLVSRHLRLMKQGMVTTLLPLVSIVSMIVMCGYRCHSVSGIILARVVTYSPVCVSLGSSVSGICASSIFLSPSGFAIGLTDVIFSRDVEAPVDLRLTSTIVSLARNKRWISQAYSTYFSL